MKRFSLWAAIFLLAACSKESSQGGPGGPGGGAGRGGQGGPPAVVIRTYLKIA